MCNVQYVAWLGRGGTPGLGYCVCWRRAGGPLGCEGAAPAEASRSAKPGQARPSPSQRSQPGMARGSSRPRPSPPNAAINSLSTSRAAEGKAAVAAFHNLQPATSPSPLKPLQPHPLPVTTSPRHPCSHPGLLSAPQLCALHATVRPRNLLLQPHKSLYPNKLLTSKPRP